MHHSIQPDEWVVLRFPSRQVRVVQVQPNTYVRSIPARSSSLHLIYTDAHPSTIALGKFGVFPANLLLGRPYHVTYEVQDRRDGESFSRLRIVSATELHTDELAGADDDDDSQDQDQDSSPTPAVEADADDATIAAPATAQKLGVQTMKLAEIEELKREGATDAGRTLVARLLSSHTALDRKSAYARAKYRLLKVKKYLRRFEVLPLHVATLAHWLLHERDAAKILDVREEMLALLGCWANVHFSSSGGTVGCLQQRQQEGEGHPDDKIGGRWLVVDDTGGLLVAAVAERMGILYPRSMEEGGEEEKKNIEKNDDEKKVNQDKDDEKKVDQDKNAHSAPQHHRNPTLNLPLTNTITVIHTNVQPSLHLLKYYNFDVSSPSTKPPVHPLSNRLFPLSWLQLLEPDQDPIYAASPALEPVAAEEVATWKASRKSTYFRKLRRWHRLRHIIQSARSGGFSGLAVASAMDAASILQHTLPLLAPGAPVAIYAPTLEPLARLADLFSTARRAAWASSPPAEAAGLTADELERWPGTADFPLNPALLLGVAVQTSRARRWQVLPGRTHPVMTSRGGADGFVLTGWKAVPLVGRIQARGKYKRRRLDESQ